jgi:hypothetical protein
MGGTRNGGCSTDLFFAKVAKLICPQCGQPLLRQRKQICRQCCAGDVLVVRATQASPGHRPDPRQVTSIMACTLRPPSCSTSIGPQPRRQRRVQCKNAWCNLCLATCSNTVCHRPCARGHCHATSPAKHQQHFRHMVTAACALQCILDT